VKVAHHPGLQGFNVQGSLVARPPREQGPGVSEGPQGKATLVDRCALGEEAAWRELYVAYQPMLIRFLRRLGLAPSDAVDGAQEVFLQVHRYLGRFEGRSDLKTWLYKLCISRAARHHRRRRVQATLAALFRRDTERPSFSQAMHESEAQVLVAAAITGLKPIHRSVFVLFEIEGLSGEEVANVVGCPVATVWRRLHNARKELAASLRVPPHEEGTP
jgi:RNA polymerase sigma-70 factor (ECF subfamily)